MLSRSTEEMIVNYNGALEQQCQGAQIVVVTVDYLDGLSTDAYAYQLFNSWGVGSSEYNNGMLLLLAVQEGKAWLAYGLGLNSVLSSQSVDDMLDEYFWTDFDNGDYDSAVTKLFNALLKWYDDEYSSSVASAGTAQTNNSYPSGSTNNGHYNTYGVSYAIRRIVRIGITVLILLAIFGGNGRGRGGGSWLPWLLLFSSRGSRRGWHDWDDRPRAERRRLRRWFWRRLRRRWRPRRLWRWFRRRKRSWRRRVLRRWRRQTLSTDNYIAALAAEWRKICQ